MGLAQPTTKFASRDIEHVTAEPDNRLRSLRLGPSGRFLRKRQGQLKGKIKRKS